MSHLFMVGSNGLYVTVVDLRYCSSLLVVNYNAVN